MVLEIEYWVEYFEINNMRRDWRIMVKEIDKSKPSELPLFKEVFYKTFVNDKPSLSSFYDYLKDNRKIKMMQETVKNKLDYISQRVWLMVDTTDDGKMDLWFWCMIARPFLGFLAEHRLKEELIKRGLDIEDTEELDNKYKVDLKINAPNSVGGIQLKNITFMYGFVNNKGYGNIHSRGLYNFAMNEVKINPTKNIKVGFLFYTFYDNGITFQHLGDVKRIVAHPLEIMECKKVRIIKNYSVEEVADFIANSMNSSLETVASGQNIE